MKIFSYIAGAFLLAAMATNTMVAKPECCPIKPAKCVLTDSAESEKPAKEISVLKRIGKIGAACALMFGYFKLLEGSNDKATEATRKELLKIVVLSAIITPVLKETAESAAAVLWNLVEQVVPIA